MRLSKGDWFEIDVDRYVKDTVAYFDSLIPAVADHVAKQAEFLRGERFLVHRTERHGEVVIYDTGDGFTGVKSKFCKKVRREDSR